MSRNHSEKIRVLLISSVTPDEHALGGSLILKRYLTDNPQVVLKTFRLNTFPLKTRIYGKLKQTMLKRIVSDIEVLSPSFPGSRTLDNVVKSFTPDLILTVAHGWWHLLASKVAKRWNLPLVTLFQDWWPDFAEVSDNMRQKVEKHFRAACESSSIAICVSEGMRSELGNPQNAIVLHDLPSNNISTVKQTAPSPPFHIMYFGNLHEYGPMVERAARAFQDTSEIKLEVYGPKPNWTPGTEAEFRAKGIYHGLVSPQEIHLEASRFHAILVVMEFQKALTRRMKTSFPSKFIEAIQMDIPVILWGPEYCSASSLAAQFNSACTINSNDAKELAVQARFFLTDNQRKQDILSRARQMQSTLFSPQFILNRFNSILLAVKNGNTADVLKTGQNFSK